MTKAEKILKAMDERDAARSAAAPAPTTEPAPTGPKKIDGMNRDRTTMRLDNIMPDLEQPREDFNEQKLADLAKTIKVKGVLLPIKVRWAQAAGKWVIVFGERRYRAAKLAGLTEIPCKFVEGDMTREEIEDEQWIENFHRDDLKPSEQAKWFSRRMVGKGWTQKQLAEHIGVSESAITKALQLLRLPDPIRALVDAGAIPVAVGADLSKIEDEAEQARVAEKIVTEGMNKVDGLAAVKAKKRPKPRARNKPTRSVTHRAANGCLVTVARKMPPMSEEVCEALREMLASYDGQGRVAA